MLRIICRTFILSFIDRAKLRGNNIMSESMDWLVLLLAMGCFVFLAVLPSQALAEGEVDDLLTKGQREFIEKTKKEFIGDFEKFKKEGLTAEQVKDLTDKLLDAAGDKIEGTGTETLLKTMNKQAENTIWIMEKKESAEEIIDFVGDVYAMASSDIPPDPVEAYKALGKGMGLAVKLAEKMPVMKVVAVPMMKAYAQAIKNGEKHIEAIAAATDAKNKAIKLGWQSMDYEEALAVTDLDEMEDHIMTEEQLQWEADRIIRQEEYGKCLDICSEEFSEYNNASTARSNARKQLEAQKGLLDNDKRIAKDRLLDYNQKVALYKEYRTRYSNAIGRRDAERARMERARAEGNLQGYQARKSMLEDFEKGLDNWKGDLQREYDKLNRVRSKYLEVRIESVHAKDKFNALLEDYNKIDSYFKKAAAAFDTCITLCEAGHGRLNAVVFDDVSGEIRSAAISVYRGKEVVSSGFWGGRFSVDLPPGDYEVRFDYALGIVRKVEVVVGKVTNEEVRGVAGRLNAVVFDDVSGEIRSAGISVYRGKEVVSGGFWGGRFSVDLPPGDYEVRFDIGEGIKRPAKVRIGQTEEIHVTTETK